MAHAGRAFQSRTHYNAILVPCCFSVVPPETTILHRYSPPCQRQSTSPILRSKLSAASGQPNPGTSVIIPSPESSMARKMLSNLGDMAEVGLEKPISPACAKKNALWNSYSTGSVLVVCEFRVVILRMLIMYIPRTARKRIALRGQRIRGLKSWILNRFQIRKCEHLQAKSKRAASQACAGFFTRKIY